MDLVSARDYALSVVAMPPAVKFTGGSDHVGTSAFGGQHAASAADGLQDDLQQRTLPVPAIEGTTSPSQATLGAQKAEPAAAAADGDLPPTRTFPADGILRGAPLAQPLAGESLGLALLRQLNDHGDRTALVDAWTGQSSTSREVVRNVVHLARALRELLSDVRRTATDQQTAVREHGAGKAKRRRSTSPPAQWAEALKQGVAQRNDFSVEKAVVTGGGRDETDQPGEGGRTEVEEDAVVGVYVENRTELVHAIIANLVLGVPLTMLSPLSNTGELVRAWSVVGPRVAMCSWSTFHGVLDAARSLPTLSHVVVFPGDVPDDVKQAAAEEDHWGVEVIQYDQLLARVEPEDGEVNLEEAKRDLCPTIDPKQHTAFLMQCTSGSLIARLTHSNFHYSVQLLQQPDTGYGWTKDDVVMLPVSFCHAFGLGICLGTLALGAKLVILPYFREQLFLGAVHDHKVSQLVLLPPQAALLARSPLLEDAVVRGLQGAVCAAAPMPRVLHRDLSRRLQLREDTRQAYGLTQASCSLLVAPRGSPPDTQGRVVPGAEAKIVDVSSGEPVPPLQVGELVLRSPSIMAGYFREEEATRQVLSEDGWLRTGDLAYCDLNGLVFVVDRLKDVTTYTRGHFTEFEDGGDLGEE